MKQFPARQLTWEPAPVPPRASATPIASWLGHLMTGTPSHSLRPCGPASPGQSSLKPSGMPAAPTTFSVEAPLLSLEAALGLGREGVRGSAWPLTAVAPMHPTPGRGMNSGVHLQGLFLQNPVPPLHSNSRIPLKQLEHQLQASLHQPYSSKVILGKLS